jgi:hypothetical protein
MPLKTFLLAVIDDRWSLLLIAGGAALQDG